MLKNIENQSGSLAPGAKRTADEMMQYVGTPVISPSSETVASDNQSDTENYAAKRSRVTEEDQANTRIPEKLSPSRVIHVRNLPQDTSESEIMNLAKVHGQVTNLILMRNKRQAFVEMHDLTQAMNFVRYHQQQLTPALIRGQPVQLQYSATYTELKPGQRSHANGMKPTPVLHVNVDNHAVPVTLPLFHQLFTKFGVVQKIITFTKNNQFQALVQMSDVQAAASAKQALDGKNVFPNCCVLRIDFSKMISINVKYNNDKSRDFTNSELPSGEGNPAPTSPPSVGHVLSAVRPVCYAPTLNASSVIGAFPPIKALNPYRMLQGVSPAMIQGFGLHPSAPAVSTAPALPGQPVQITPTRLPVAQPLDSHMSPSQLHLQQLVMNQLQANPLHAQGLAPAAPPAAAPQIKIPNMLQLPQMIPSTPTSLAQDAQAHSNQQMLPKVADQQQLMLNQLQFQQQIVQQHQLQQQQLLQQQQQFVNSPATTATAASVPQLMAANVSSANDMRTPSPDAFGSPVVLVSNLNPEKVSPDALFTLFGMYGDVIRVKILYHRLDTALVQYTDQSSATTACKYLDKATFWNNEIRVIPSRYHNIQMPSQDSSREGLRLTQDYSGSDKHRYRKLGTRNLSNIYPPSNTLHISNLPDTVEENNITGAFSAFGTVASFKFFVKDKRMALIQMSSISEAIEALIGLHNLPMNNAQKIRVSFSKSPIQV